MSCCARSIDTFSTIELAIERWKIRNPPTTAASTTNTAATIEMIAPGRERRIEEVLRQKEAATSSGARRRLERKAQEHGIAPAYGRRMATTFQRRLVEAL